MGNVITFNVAEFRLAFPAFASTETYPDALLQGNWDSAACIISPKDYGYLHGACRARALNLLTAHLTALGDIIKAGGSNPGGNVPGLVQSATIDKVTVTLTPPPVKTQFAWWLSLTPYGQQLFALLQAKAVGGFVIGGLPEGAAFRKVGGMFLG